jgi:hypothetical protein
MTNIICQLCLFPLKGSASDFLCLHLDEVNVMTTFSQQREGAAIYIPPVPPEIKGP